MSHKITIKRRVISILNNLSEEYVERAKEYDSESGLYSFYYGMVFGINQAMAVIIDHKLRKGGKKR